MLAGFIGMKIATYTNVRVTYKCGESANAGFMVAFHGGQVLGFSLVGLALFILEIIIMAYKPSVMDYLGENALPHVIMEQVRYLFEGVSGYGLGASTVALFGRVGGGIYTKAADVGADLAGKVGEHLDEDSPLTPEPLPTMSVTTLVTLLAWVLISSVLLLNQSALPLLFPARHGISSPPPDAIYFPLMIVVSGIIASWLSQFFAWIPMSVEAKLRT